MSKRITVNSYCQRCRASRYHEIYLDSTGYLHSSCGECGTDVSSRGAVMQVVSERIFLCKEERSLRRHVRYLGEQGDTHYLCCTCGKDVAAGRAGCEAPREEWQAG